MRVRFGTEFQKRLVDRSDVRVAFPRQVDLWWCALGIGVVEGHRTPLPDRDRLVKFNDGGILESDPWRTTRLELLALAEVGRSAKRSAYRVWEAGAAGITSIS